MRFTLTPEQHQFADAVHELLSSSDVAGAASRWAAGSLEPGLKIWRALADLGVTALAVPEWAGGLGASAVDLVVACEELGHHAVPGPVAESLAAVPALLADEESLRRLAEGDLIATLAAPPWQPYAADADAAGLVLLVTAGSVRVGVPGPAIRTLDDTRRLFPVHGGELLASDADAERAVDLAALATAAQLLGAGRALLETAVTYAGQRTQFGQPIGRFQAVQHQLADVAIALEFARPLLYGAAVTLAARDVSAAKVACAAAAHLAARKALQVHGAIGYTREYGLDRWLTKVRALVPAWGSQSAHRARVMAALTVDGA